jgi:hypothetical protein
MSVLIISRSFKFLARWLRMRIPREQMFSVVVCSVSAGSRRLDICTGTASRIRFSIRPDRIGIWSLTSQTAFGIDAPG